MWIISGSVNSAEAIGHLHVEKKMSLDPFFPSYTKKKFCWKWLTGLNVKPKTIIFLEENIPGQLFDLGLGKGSLKNDINSTTPQKKQIDRLYFIEIKVIIS